MLSKNNQDESGMFRFVYIVPFKQMNPKFSEEHFIVKVSYRDPFTQAMALHLATVG